MGKGRPFWAQYAATIDRRRLGAIAVLLLDAFLLAVFLAPAKARQIENTYTPVFSSVFEPSSFNFDAAEDNSPTENRSFYPYSVIPGGAKTALELRNAVANDAVVRAHYADFKMAGTRVERLEKPQAFYVSYRIGSAIFWTKNQLMLPAGERVLTDGSNMARTRCGNRLSVVPVAPVSDVEPSPEAMEAPAGGVLLASIVATPAELPIAPPLATMIAPVPGAAPPASGFTPPFFPYFPFVPGGAPPPQGTPGTPTPPIIPPPSGPTPPATPPVAPPPPATPPVATPEPSVVLLLAAGFGCLLVLKKLR